MPSQQLIQPQPTNALQPDQQRLRPAGWLLVAGALVSLAAGATPSMYDLYTSQTPQLPPDHLQRVAQVRLGVALAWCVGR
jgi:hypothetical protein